jgi:hypothetical protein
MNIFLNSPLIPHPLIVSPTLANPLVCSVDLGLV